MLNNFLRYSTLMRNRHYSTLIAWQCFLVYIVKLQFTFIAIQATFLSSILTNYELELQSIYIETWLHLQSLHVMTTRRRWTIKIYFDWEFVSYSMRLTFVFKLIFSVFILFVIDIFNQQTHIAWIEFFIDFYNESCESSQWNRLLVFSRVSIIRFSQSWRDHEKTMIEDSNWLNLSVFAQLLRNSLTFFN